MISRPHSSSVLPALALFFLLFVGLSAWGQNDENAGAVKATEEWLRVIDAGEYGKSWQEAAPSFQGAVSERQWIQALDGVRKPLGHKLERKVASSLHQTQVPTSEGKMVQGDFVITQFETSFENLKYAIETVTFEKVGDVWKASGYFIKPKV